jgi:hypothetical protein
LKKGDRRNSNIHKTETREKRGIVTKGMVTIKKPALPKALLPGNDNIILLG